MSIFNPHKGTWVLFSFVAFFGVIIAVNSVFITTALNSHSGVVTKQPYEKGLAYNQYLEKAEYYRENKLHQLETMMQVGQKKSGMTTLNQNLFKLFKAGHITKEQCMQNSLDVEQMQVLFRKAGL